MKKFSYSCNRSNEVISRFSPFQLDRAYRTLLLQGEDPDIYEYLLSRRTFVSKLTFNVFEGVDDFDIMYEYFAERLGLFS